MDFLFELFTFLRSRWKLWLRPVFILFVIIGLLLLINGILEYIFSPKLDETVVPFSRSHYRHDDELFNKYSAIILCPSRFG
jgi:uncharacterized membrane protein